MPVTAMLARAAALTLICVAVVGCGSGSAPAPAGLSDTAIQAAMAANMNSFRSSTSAVLRDANDVPDIAVKDAVLIVATTDPAGAAALCHTVAGMTNSPDTAKPLGVIGVTIISGGKSIATCTP